MDKFHIIPWHPNYEMTITGKVRERESKLEVPVDKSGRVPSVVIDGESIPTPKLLAWTFIGRSSLPIILETRYIESRSVTYFVQDKVRLPNGDYMLGSEMFKRIPVASDYFINEYGAIWCHRNKRFVHVSYEAYGHQMATLTNDKGVRQPFRVDKYVYLAWVDPEMPLDYIVMPKDENVWNVHYTNLVAGDSTSGLRKRKKGPYGENDIWYPEDKVHGVCKMILENADIKDICDYLGLDYKTNRTRVTNLVHRLIYGKSYKHVACHYDFSMRRRTREEIEDYAGIII